MRWKSGLVRLWLVGSISWIVYCAWQSDLACPLQLVGIATGAGPWCDFQNAEPLKYYTGLGIEMLGPPLLAAIGSLGAGWILAGFRPGT
jgi:hypothetical protein